MSQFGIWILAGLTQVSLAHKVCKAFLMGRFRKQEVSRTSCVNKPQPAVSRTEFACACFGGHVSHWQHPGQVA